MALSLLVFLSAVGFASSYTNDQKDVGNFITCKACTWTLGKIEEYLFTKDNEHKVLEFVEQVCDKLPTSYVETCKSLVENYGTEALDTLLKKVGSPEHLCELMGQCDAALTHATLLWTLPKDTTCEPCKRVIRENRQNGDSVAGWWQSSCTQVEDIEGCIRASEYLRLLNKALFDESACNDMEFC